MPDEPILTRRAFVAGSAAAMAGGLMPVRLSLAADRQDLTRDTVRPRSQAAYGLAFLGDLHYDKWEHHDLDWLKAEMPKDIRQIEGYVEVTRTHTPRLFERVRKTIQEAPAKVAATIHIGDFVEGLCGSYDLQARQFREAMSLVNGSDLGVPFLLTKGNHDITGPRAKEAFDEVLRPWMGKQAARELTSANYTWSHGNDLFIFFDAYQPELEWLRAQSGNAADARHVFFVIHPPVVPYNARANWHVFSRPEQAEHRERLLRWIAEHQAIVLSGHLHRYSLLTRRTEVGPFVQFAVNSVVRHDKERPRNERSGVGDYGVSLLDLEPDFSPGSVDERKAWLEWEQPQITAFDYALVPGYAMIWVYDDRAEADVSLGYAAQAWKQLRLDPAVAL